MNLFDELSRGTGSARRRWLLIALLGAFLFTAVGGATLAQEESGSSEEYSSESSESGSSSGAAASEGSGAPAYVMPYALVIACVGLGLMVVCRSASRETLIMKWKGVGISTADKKEEEGGKKKKK